MLMLKILTNVFYKIKKSIILGEKFKFKILKS